MDALKTLTKKVARKAAQATGELIGSKTANKIVKPKPVPDENSKNVEEIIIPLENIKWIKKSIIKLEHFKMSALLNNSTMSIFVTKK